VKLGSKADAAAIVAAYSGEEVGPDLSPKDLDMLAEAGNDAARRLLTIRERQKVLRTIAPKVAEAEQAVRLSKRLVTLDDHTPLGFSLDDLVVR